MLGCVKHRIVNFSRVGDTENAEGVLKTPERRVFGSPGVSSATAGRRPVLVPQNPSDGAISNFFHALLNKKSGQAALNASGNGLSMPGGFTHSIYIYLCGLCFVTVLRHL
jgi:hypothetical protein